MRTCVTKSPDSASKLERWVYEHLVDPVVPHVVDAGISANAVTVAGMVLSGTGVWAACRGFDASAALCIMGRVYCDWLDGPVARCSQSTSDLGDALDHTSDLLFYGGMGYVLAQRLHGAARCGFLVLLALLAYAAAASYGCTEKYSGSKHNRFLSMFAPLCRSRSMQAMLQRLNAGDLLVSALYLAVLAVTESSPA